MAMVATGRCLDQVTLPKAMLPDDVRWNPGISRVGEVAVRGPANEPAIARWIEPSDRLAVGNDRCRRRLNLVGSASATAASAMTPVASSVAMVLVVATLVSTFVTTVEVLSAALMFVPVI